eukprot:437620_1
MALIKTAFIFMTALIALCIVSFFILAPTLEEMNKDSLFIDHEYDKSVMTEWDAIISQRTKFPLPCNYSSQQNIVKISPETNNWLPYYLRCNYIIPALTINDGIAGELFYSKQLNYIHNYKAGGSTIQIGLNKLNIERKLNINGQIHRGGISKGNFTKFVNSDATIFTFIRDPIEKFLSAFAEAIKRHIKKGGKGMRKYDIDFYEMSGIQVLRIWIANMLESTADLYISNITQNINIGKGRNTLEPIPETKWIDFHSVSNHHIMEPMHSLFTFVGNLENLNNDLPQVLSKYISDHKLKYNSSLLMDKYFKRQRNRNNGYITNNVSRKFNLKRSDLSDNDIHNICRIYWSDYICFPFQIPIACNITQLFLKHYHRYVKYKSCY